MENINAKVVFKPKKSIVSILNKLFEQFNKLTHKDIKKVNSYKNSVKTKVVVPSEEYLQTINSVITANATNKDVPSIIANLLSELRRLATDGKPSIKFQLNFEEFNIIKKWVEENTSFVNKK